MIWKRRLPRSNRSDGAAACRVGLWSFIATLILTSPLHAQRPAPFESFRIALDVLTDVNTSTFHDLWDPQPGVRLTLGAPFYFGDVAFGVSRFQNRSREPLRPDFTSTYIFLGWGVAIQLPANLEWVNGGAVGTYRMAFDDPAISEALRLEQELALGVRTRLQFRASRHWALHVAGEYQVVMTRVRIKHLFVSVGASGTFGMPKWLQEFLR